MRVALLTLGCKVNQSELMGIEAALRETKSISIVGLYENPDICVINTCTVTAKSDYQSRQLIRRAAATGARLIVTGCYSELNPQAAGSMRGVSKIVHNREKDSIINMITGNASSEMSEIAAGRKGRSRYFLKVQDGCDYSCSYCIVWKARGPARSVRPEEVIAGVRRAVESGYKEVVLTGIHLGLYGRDMARFRDLDDKRGLYRLVKKILEETEIPRLRLSSLEINEVDDGLIELIKGERLAGHLHLPLQSGDDRVLKLMKRHYDSRTFVDKVKKLVKEIPHVGLGTDVIAGFPGEGDAEFQNTVSVLEELPFTYMHVFTYSPRPGTEAANLGGKVDETVKKRRSSILRGMARDKKRSFIENLKGARLKILLECGPGDYYNGEGKKDCWYLGVAGNYVKVHIPHEYTQVPGYAAGSLIDVEIVGQKEGMAVGKPVIGS